MVEMRRIRTQTCDIMQYKSQHTSIAGYGKFLLRKKCRGRCGEENQNSNAPTIQQNIQDTERVMLVLKKASRSRCYIYEHKSQGGCKATPLAFVVEMRRIELLSENPSTQLSSWTVCYLEFPSGSANRHAIPSGSPFMHDRFKCEQPMHVHHSNDAQSEAVVLIGGTGDPQVTALPSLR